MGSQEDADESAEGSQALSRRGLARRILQAVVLAVVLWIAVPFVYPPIIEAIGADTADSDVPSVLAIQIIAASYPIFSFLVDQALRRYYGYDTTDNQQDSQRADDGDFQAVIESLPSDAIGQLEDGDVREGVIDEELTEEYQNRSIPGIHPAWTVSQVIRERVYAETPRRCVHTREELPPGEEHLLLEATYSPPQFDPQHVWFRFSDEEAIHEWFNERFRRQAEAGAEATSE